MGSASKTLGPARNRQCVRCGGPAESWQHRVAAGRGGPDDHFNCVPLCGDGTRGCHGWAEANPTAAQAEYLDVPGSFTRGRYEGPDAYYRAVYNREQWDPADGWVATDLSVVALIGGLVEEGWT
ncbi:MAG: hypothetical protein ABR616_09970 [Dermatophilaceae bacterium]